MPEEKRTDVNIAIHMLNDAILDKCERFILISGDSDICPVLNMIRNLKKTKEIIVYIPAKNRIRGAAIELRSFADKHKILPQALINKALPLYRGIVEINKVTDRNTGKTQVVNKLSLHNVIKLFDRLEFKNNGVVYNKVCDIPTDELTLVV